MRVSWLDSTYPALYFEVDTDFTIKDYEDAVDRAWEMLADYTDDAPVYVVADVSQVRNLPPQMIITMLQIYKSPHSAFSGLTIFVGAPRVVRYLTTRFAPIFRTSKFHFAESLEDLDVVIEKYHQNAQGKYHNAKESKSSNT